MLKYAGVNGGFWGEGSALLAELTGLLLSRWGAGSDSGELELRDGQKETGNSCHKVPLHVLLAELTGLLLSRWGAGSDCGELDLMDGQKELSDKVTIIEN